MVEGSWYIPLKKTLHLLSEMYQSLNVDYIVFE